MNKFSLLTTISFLSLMIGNPSFGMYRRDKKVEICRQRLRSFRKPNYRLSMFSRFEMKYNQPGTDRKLLYACNQKNHSLYYEFLFYTKKHRNAPVTVQCLCNAAEIARINQDEIMLEFIKCIPRISYVLCLRQNEEGVKFLQNLENLKITNQIIPEDSAPIIPLEDLF